MSPPITDPLQERIAALGLSLWQSIGSQSPGVFASGWQGRLLESAMADPQFKLDLFRFVDVLPSLRTGRQVARHVREYLQRDGRELPALLGAAIALASGGLASPLAARAIRRNVEAMAQRFIAGATVDDALPVLRTLREQDLAFTVDLLGEATLSASEARVYEARYMELIDRLATAAAGWPPNPRLDRDHTGPVPAVNVSLKISAMHPHLDPVDPSGSVERLRPRVLALLQRARERNVFVNFDLEQWSLHGITYDLFESVCTDPSLRDWPHLGIVVQAYLKSADADVERLVALARRRSYPVTVRLVKGAYWEHEVALARQMALPESSCPVFTDKAATDRNYERLTAMLFDHIDLLGPALGCPNLRSITRALGLAAQTGLPREA